MCLTIQKQNYKYILQLKEVIALKLYCDFDSLQGEYKKCFRSPYNEDTLRLRSFYHWNQILSNTIKKLSNPRLKLHKSKLQFDHKRFKSVYHGVSSLMDIKLSLNNTYKFHGPLSTTTDIFIARSFAGSKGMIIEIEFVEDPEQLQGNKKIASKPIDITYFSAFPEEQEILCFDQSICVKSIITSSEFDAKYLNA